MTGRIGRFFIKLAEISCAKQLWEIEMREREVEALEALAYKHEKPVEKP